jgi:hypothetical protein
MSQPPGLPHNFVDEVEAALEETHVQRDHDRELLVVLEELHALSLGLSFKLKRPVTVFDVIHSATDDGERTRRQALIRTLRAGRDEGRPPGLHSSPRDWPR